MNRLFQKVLWIDTETTGTDPSKHGIIQLAALMEIGGTVVDQFEIKMQPHAGAEISAEALEVSGTKIEDLARRATSDDAYFQFVRWIGKHVDKYDKADKAYPAAYNAHFDFDFLQAWARINGNRFGFGSYINWRFQDPLALLRILDCTGKVALSDYKLPTVCAHFGIELKAHDALSDIKAARELYRILVRDLKL